MTAIKQLTDDTGPTKPPKNELVLKAFQYCQGCDADVFMMIL